MLAYRFSRLPCPSRLRHLAHQLPFRSCRPTRRSGIGNHLEQSLHRQSRKQFKTFTAAQSAAMGNGQEDDTKQMARDMLAYINASMTPFHAVGMAFLELNSEL